MYVWGTQPQSDVIAGNPIIIKQEVFFSFLLF